MIKHPIYPTNPSIDQAIQTYLKGQQEGVAFLDLLDATGFSATTLMNSVVGLEYIGRITSGEGEYPLYQLAQPRPVVVPQGRTPVCVSCVKCGECPDPDELPEEAVYY